MRLFIPNRLKKGDTIGIISPSAGVAPFAMHRIENAVKYLEDMGFKVKIGKHALKNDGYVSAPIKDRVKDIHFMFLDPEVKCIICTIGGNNSNQLLPFLDYKLMRKNPKIFVGYSDITVLHFAIQKMSGLATYFGPCLMTQFGEYAKPLDYSIKYFLGQVFGKKKKNIRFEPSESWTEEVLNWFEKKDLQRPRKLLENKGYCWIRKGNSKGKAWGGTIPSINYLLGTKYWVEPDDSIFFLDIPEGRDIMSGLSLAEVDAYLTNLDNAGVFKKINGLVIGRPYKYSREQIEEFKKIVLRITKPYSFPILLNVDLGHTDPIITLRYGQMLELDGKKNIFQTS